MHTLMPTVLLRVTGLDELVMNAKPDPPDREPAESSNGQRREGNTVVREYALRETILPEEPLEYRLRALMRRRAKRFRSSASSRSLMKIMGVGEPLPCSYSCTNAAPASEDLEKLALQANLESPILGQSRETLNLILCYLTKTTGSKYGGIAMQSGEEPTGVEENRTARRIPVEVLTEFVVGEAAAANGVAKDLSVTGVWIEAQTGSLNVGEQVKLRFSILPGTFATEFPGRIVRKATDGFGVQFLNLEAHHLQILLEFFSRFGVAPSL